MGMKTFKDMFSSEDTAAVDETTSDPGTSGHPNPNADATSTSKSPRRLFGKRTSLPPGTGPGTSGHPAAASEVPMQNHMERSKAGQNSSGYGSDAAAAMGGSLAGTHQGTGIDRSAARDGRARTMNGDQVTTGGQAKAGELDSGTEGAMRGTRTTDQGLRNVGIKDLGLGHLFGHSQHGAIPDPTLNEAQQLNNMLRPVIHEKIRHVENEEIAYVNEKERHIHHVQHHTHPIIVKEESPELLRENAHPTINQIKETHSITNPLDRNTFEGQIRQHRDTSAVFPKERKIIHKGTTTVKETVHHHIHHVIQPVIEKEVIRKERIRTTIPIHEEVHDAPVIHQVKSHSPIPFETFMKKFGSFEQSMTHDEIIEKVLGNGQCVREGGDLDSFGDMNLGNKNVQGTTAHTHTNSNIGSGGEGYGVPSKSGTQHTAPLDQTTFPQPVVMPSMP